MHRVEVYIAIVIVAVLLRYVVTEYTTRLYEHANKYMVSFVTLLIVILLLSKNGHVALLVSLAVVTCNIVFDYLVYKQSEVVRFVVFVMSIIAALVLQHVGKTGKTPLIHWPLYILLIYWMASFIEYVVHKYVMHCYTFLPWLDVATNTTTAMQLAQNLCHGHHQHHIEVNNDMSLKENPLIEELYFHWPAIVIVAAISIIMGYVFVLLLRLDIRLWQHVLTTAIVAIIGSFVWNTIHPAMHGVHELRIPPSVGVPRGDVMMSEDNVYYANHEAHHVIKGKEKGNFNIVFLGVDQLLNKNRIADMQ